MCCDRIADGAKEKKQKRAGERNANAINHGRACQKTKKREEEWPIGRGGGGSGGGGGGGGGIGLEG